MHHAPLALRQLVQFARELIFPPHCAACNRGGIPYCDDCLAQINATPGPRCSRCDAPLDSTSASCAYCRSAPLPELDGLRLLAWHDSPLKEAIHALKYDYFQALATPLGHLLGHHWQTNPTPLDGLIPVPLHPHRIAERGFNQSELLAQAMATHLHLPVETQALHRRRATPPQVGQNRAARLANVAGAFEASPTVDGGAWLLVDDVCTTGATLTACATALRAQGAAHVWSIVLARPRH